MCKATHYWGTLTPHAVNEVITTLMERYASGVLSSIPLSNNVVSGRIDDMAKKSFSMTLSIVKSLLKWMSRLIQFNSEIVGLC